MRMRRIPGRSRPGVARARPGAQALGPGAARSPLIARPPARNRAAARQQAQQRVRQLGPDYRVAHHRHPRTGRRHYHIVRPGPRRRLIVTRDYYPYPAPGLPGTEPDQRGLQLNRLLPQLPAINRRGPRYQRWLAWALARAHELLHPRLAHRIADRLRFLKPGWERAEWLLIRHVRPGLPPVERP